MRNALSLVLFGAATGAAAECRIALPVQEPQAQCTPRAAAAYDFAFCSVSLYISALSAPPLPNEDGDSLADSLHQASNAYARVSLALSDADKVKGNVEAAKRYYDSLRDKGDAVTPALHQIGLKCRGINQYHNEVLEEAAREIRSKRR
ncbi:MAG TPA: hypothetical protein VEB41_13900 [Burkholderiales bacterium]|nr:hypothetical protein [Burkholderiales bacterium]